MNIETVLPKAPAMGKQLTITLMIEKAKLPDAIATETATTTDEAGETTVKRANYSLSLDIAEILEVEIDDNFEPSDEESKRLEQFIETLFKKVAEKIEVEIYVCYYAYRYHALAMIDGQKAKGLTLKLVEETMRTTKE